MGRELMLAPFFFPYWDLANNEPQDLLSESKVSIS